MITPRKMARAMRKALKHEAARLVYQTIAPNRFILWLPGEEYRRLLPLVPKLEEELGQQAEKTAQRLEMRILPGGMDVRITSDPAPRGKSLRVRASFSRETSRRASLVGLEGFSRGLIYPLTRPRTVIGRGGADLCLPNEARGVSRRHALLSFSEKGFVLKDLGSGTGTFVNEEPVEQKPLTGGERIFIGSVVLGFKAGAVGEVAHA